MRRTAFLLLALALLPGCVDATGIFSDCSGDMARTRGQYGQPNETESDEDRGDYYELWDYYDHELRFVFRWGASIDGCQVSRSPLRNVMPLPLHRPIGSATAL